MKYAIPNRLASIPPLAERVAAFLADAGVSQETAMTLNLCLDELLTNTIEYGYSDQTPHEIEIEVCVTGEELQIAIIDDANPFDPTQDAPVPDLTPPLGERPIGGLGLFLVKNFTDSIQYNRHHHRNHLLLKKRLPSPLKTK